MDAIESLPYVEDIQKLSTRYDSNVVCASVKVLVNNDSSNLRSLLSSSVENSEPEEVADEDVVWDAEPKPITQEAPPVRPEAIEEDYMKEKPCEDDDDGDRWVSDKPGDPEVGPPKMMEADLAEVSMQQLPASSQVHILNESI
ncbi:hypothetical protein FOYG_02112 [Fusarium oxysporum NRRL 32931]|uniref:Uncharacterized protein n=1 Tax=Fusarium oxysporum NRRL 32931 TaxID=660029 RepID=W9J7C4_FUSOX|nr:hypothetical protein FOYG_02112 [Fusarium oxysporum NRRL 32931]